MLCMERKGNTCERCLDVLRQHVIARCFGDSPMWSVEVRDLGTIPRHFSIYVPKIEAPFDTSLLCIALRMWFKFLSPLRGCFMARADFMIGAVTRAASSFATKSQAFKKGILTTSVLLSNRCRVGVVVCLPVLILVDVVTIFLDPGLKPLPGLSSGLHFPRESKFGPEGS